jgi:SSS family solute:Na+ symporter
VDYFLASRASRWALVGLASFASNMSPTALVALAGGAYAMGLAVYDYEWSAVPILVFFCVFMVPIVIASRSYTMPEFLERRYDRRARVLFAIMTLFLIVFVDSAGVLYSASLVCQLLVPGLRLGVIVLVIAAAAGTYTIMGGLRAVMVTEAVQALVLLAGAALIAAGALERVGGLHAIRDGLDPAMLSLIRPIGTDSVPWPGLLFGIPILGFYYWCTNQSIVQRVLSARDVDQARWGTLLTGLLKLPVLVLMVLPGLCAILLMPHLEQTDRIYPQLILLLLPAGALGLVVAGFLAAAVVASASMFNSAASLITLDVIQVISPQLSDRALVRTGRWTTAGLIVFAIAWAPQLGSFRSLWQYLQSVLAYTVPPVVTVFMAGLFWRRASAAAAAVTLAAGFAAGAALFVVNVLLHWTHLHFLYAAVLLCAFDTVILVQVSLRSREELTRARAAVMWQAAPRRSVGRGAPAVRGWRDYRYQAAALLVLTLCLVFVLR